MVKLLKKIKLLVPVLVILLTLGNSYKSLAKGYEGIAPQIIKALLVNLRLSTDVRFGAVTSHQKLGTLSIFDLIVRTDFGKFSFEEITFSRPSNPQNNDMFVDGQIEVSGFHYEISSRHLPFEFVAMSREAGFAKFTGDAVIQFAYHLGNSTLDYTLNFTLNGGGDLTVSNSISDIYVGTSLVDFISKGPGSLSGDSLHAKLKSFTFSFFDKGLVNKAIQFQSKQTERNPSQIRREIPVLLSKQAKQATQKLPSKEKIFRFIDKGEAEVRKFLLNPKNLTLSIIPGSPIPFEKIEGFIEGGDFDLLNLQFHANRNVLPIATKQFKRAIDSKGKDAVKLAMMYLQGIGTPQNFSKAARLLKNTKTLKDPEALFSLSQVYFDGTGIEKDLKRAYELALFAGARGHFTAGNLLTKIEAELTAREITHLQNGAATEWDKSEETHFLKRNKTAALGGDLSAMRILAKAYLRGSKLPRNYKLAYVWSSLGAAAGDPISRSIRDRILSVSGKSGVLEARDIVAAQDLAEELWKRNLEKTK